jgi:putative redox protein
MAEAVRRQAVLVSETGAGGLQLVVRTADGSFIADEPADVGGLGSGPNPFDLLSAALGSCTAMTLRLYAQRKTWPLQRVQVRVLHQRASLGARDTFETAVSLEGPLTDEQRARLMQIAEQCPVHRTLAGGADIRTIAGDGAGMAGVLAGASDHMACMQEACADNH